MNGILESIATNAFGGLFANLASSYVLSKGRSIHVSKDVLQTNLRDHFQVTFSKCTKIKTILNDSPVDFLALYTDQNFKIENKILDQYDVVDLIKNGTSCCITGTGGGGKSMFVRYLWLSFLENSGGKIPFFLELRHLNSLSHDNLEDFIFHSIIATGSSIPQNSFKQAMKNGEFILMLDGFDEINVELRSKYEAQIINLKENNPKLAIVVTSRPDIRFSGWHQFHNAEVMPLKKDQVIALITKTEFNEDAKKSLLKKIKAGLYESHPSFLSNPLLASMMLFTISYNPDIPFRMFSFYEQAFEALYYRHDLTKGGYKRKFLSKIEKHEFIRILSYFCLITYYKELFEFSEDLLREFCTKAIAIESKNVNANDFAHDIIESVCVLKKDGLVYSFTHRSFQEYFAAFCLSKVTGKNIEGFFSNFAKRYEDQVIGMTYDMNPFLFREKYVVPINSRHKDFFDFEDSGRDAPLFLEKIKGIFLIRRHSPVEGKKKKIKSKKRYFITLEGSGEFYDLYTNITRLAKNQDTRDNNELIHRREIDDFFAQAIFSAHPKNGDDLQIRSSKGKISFFLGGKNVTNANLYETFATTLMYDFLITTSSQVRKFVRAEISQFQSVSNEIEDLLK